MIFAGTRYLKNIYLEAIISKTLCWWPEKPITGCVCILSHLHSLQNRLFVPPFLFSPLHLTGHVTLKV